MRRASAIEEIEYPSSDGKPMAEDTKQFDAITALKVNLDDYFKENVFVAGDLFWYPVEGKPRIVMAPDVLVAIGRPKGDRSSYMQWKEGNTPPQVVIEVLSHNNRPQEMLKKHRFYQKYGVLEYYILDSVRDEWEGFRRKGQRLVRIKNLDGWVSPELDIRFVKDPDGWSVFLPDGTRVESTQDIILKRKRFEEEAKQERRQKIREMKQKEDALREKNDALREKDDALREKEDALRERDESLRRLQELEQMLRSKGIDPNPSGD